jgi:hypothetical protein
MSILTPIPFGDAWFTTREIRSEPAAVLDVLLFSTLIGWPEVRGGILVDGRSPFELTVGEDT